MCGSIDDTEWRRFLFYANLVRSYKSFGERIDGVTAATLSDQTGGQPLFPRLTSLHWSHPTEYSAAFVLFLSPMLKNVTFDFGSDLSPVSTTFTATDDPGDYTTAAALRLIYARAPRIEHLDIHIGYSYAMKSIPAFKDVLSLTLRDIKDPAVIGLACSPLERLQKLKVTLIPEDAESMFQRIPDIMLPEVTEMSLESSPHVVGLIINSMHAPKLSALTASMELVDAPVKQCITLIAERFTSSLRNLTLHIDDLDDFSEDEIDPPIPTARSFADFFAPLYTLRALTRVAIAFRFETPCIITDADMSRIAEAWPGLRTLHLPFVINGGMSPTFSITGLPLLTKRCVHLHSLFIPLPDASPLKDMDLASLPPYSNVVTRLYVAGNRWPKELREKAYEYLDHIFPQVRDRGIILGEEDFDDLP